MFPQKDPRHEGLHPSSSVRSLYMWFTRGLVSLPDILACLGARASKYVGNWKMRAFRNPAI